MLNRKMKPIAAAVGAAFAASLATGAVADEGTADPFEAELLQGVVLADAHGGEGKCGEGEGEGEAKCGEGKCGEGEGSGDTDEAKCGEGKCGEGEGEESAEEAEEE